MKALHILFFISLFTFPLRSVAEDEPLNSKKQRDILVYMELGGSLNYFSAKLGGTVVLNHTHSFSATAYAHMFYARDVPGDFYKGGLIFLGPKELIEQHNTIDLMYGLMVHDADIPFIRLNFRGGVSIGTYLHATNFTPYKDPNPGLFSFGSSNYTYQILKERSVGLVLNPVIEIPICVPFGISIGGYANFNNRVSFARFEVNLLFGITRTGATPDW